MVGIEHRSSSLAGMLHTCAVRYEVRRGQTPDILSHTGEEQVRLRGEQLLRASLALRIQLRARALRTALHGFSCGGIVRLGCNCDPARCFGAALTNMAFHLELETPVTVLGKRGVVWDLLIEAQAGKPAQRQSAQSPS